MNILAFLTVLLIAIRRSGVASEDKSCSCEEGELCNTEVQPVDCEPCPPRTYQSQPVHDKTYCNPWTTKGPDSNYVLKKSGTAISDNVWECDVGYEEKKYSVNEYECVEIDNPPTTTEKPTPTTSHTSVSSTPSYEETTTAVPSKKDGLSAGGIAGIVVGVGLMFIVIFLIIFFLYYYFCKDNFKRRYERFCCKSKMDTESGIELTGLSQQKKENRPTDKSNRSGNASTGDTEGCGNENLPLDATVSLDFKNCFEKIVSRLGKEIYAFINLLDDSEGKFNAKSTIKSELKKHIEPENAYIKACLEWVKQTKLDHKKCIIYTLLEMEKQDLIDELFWQQEDAINNDENKGAVGGQNSGGDSTTQKTVFQSQGQGTRAKADSKLFKLYYHLVKFIGLKYSERLLKLLPNENRSFSVENSIQNGRTEFKELKVCHIETFIEWKKKNRDIEKLKDIIVGHLSEIGRQDAAEKEEILNLISEHDDCFSCDPKDGHHPSSSNQERRAKSIDNSSNRLNIYEPGAVGENNPQQSTRSIDDEESGDTQPLINENANEITPAQAPDSKKQDETNPTTLDEDEVDFMPSADETEVKKPLISDNTDKNEKSQAIDNALVQTPGSKNHSKTNRRIGDEDGVDRLPSFDERSVAMPRISDHADKGKKTFDSKSMQTSDFKKRDNIDSTTLDEEEDVQVMPSSDETTVKKIPLVSDNADEHEKTCSTFSSSFGKKSASSISVRPVPTCAKSVNAVKDGKECDLFYLLDRKLGKEDSKKLLEKLPNDCMKFNAKTSLRLGKMRPNVVFETFCAWRECNPTKDLKACIMDGLKELGMNDIVEDEELVNHISFYPQPPAT